MKVILVSYKQPHSSGWILIHLRTNFTNDISTASPCPAAFEQLGLVYSRKTQYKMFFFFLPKKGKKGDKIVITGSGPTVTKTITCAEIIKRKFKVSSQRAITLYAWVTEKCYCAPMCSSVGFRVNTEYDFWASESFRQDIGRFHSPWMKASGCKENHFYSLPFGQSEASIY